MNTEQRGPNNVTAVTLKCDIGIEMHGQVQACKLRHAISQGLEAPIIV